MFTDLQLEYKRLSDDELLHLAHARSTLTDEAKVALDAEMLSRDLTAVNIRNHARFERKTEMRESRRKRRKLFGIRVPQRSGVEILVAFFWMAIAISLILLGYFSLPTRYRLPAEWQETAGIAMYTSVFLAAWFFRDWGRRLGFWITLLISSMVHALILHAWISRIGSDMLWRNRGGKGVMFLGIILFFVLYAGGGFVRRKFYDGQTSPKFT